MLSAAARFAYHLHAETYLQLSSPNAHGNARPPHCALPASLPQNRPTVRRRLCLELLLLFCPKVYDGSGLLLEQCDRPSIFQAISFSFANRARGTMVGSWLEVGDVNGTSGVNA